jgi:hypothetical protein
VVPEYELQDAGQVVQVLAGVEQVHDLRRLGELGGGDVPDPGGAVAEDGELSDVIGAAADALGLYEAGERVRGLEGSDVAGGVPVPDRVSLVVHLVLGEEDGELDLAGAGAAVLALALPAGCFLRGDRTPVPSIAAYSLSGSGNGGSGTSFLAVTSDARSRTVAAAAAPLLSAALSTRLTVSRTPARTSSSRAAFANGPAAAASSFIAAAQATRTRPPRRARRPAGRTRARRPRSDTTRA